jgi:hypothetical protein
VSGPQTPHGMLHLQSDRRAEVLDAHAAMTDCVAPRWGSVGQRRNIAFVLRCSSCCWTDSTSARVPRRRPHPSNRATILLLDPDESARSSRSHSADGKPVPSSTAPLPAPAHD